MNEIELDKLVLDTIRQFNIQGKHPHPTEVHAKIKKGGKTVSPNQVLDAIGRLEDHGKIAKANYYYVK